MTLRQIRLANPFAAVRDFDDAAHHHVWHSRLGVSLPADAAAVTALEAGRGFAILGPPGSGKTSTLAAAALGTNGVARTHVPLPISIAGTDVAAHAGDPRYLAGRLVRGIAQLCEQATRLVDDAATAGTVSRAAVTWKAQAGPRFATLTREVRQRTENVDFERTPEEVVDTARAAIQLLRERQVRPVLLLEDADGLLRLPGLSEQQRHEVANTFFADGLAPLLRQIGVPSLLAIQPEYTSLEGYHAVAPLLDGAVEAPKPLQFSEGGVRILLSEALRLSNVDRQVTDVFSDDALAVLIANRYSVQQTIRALLQVCDRSLLQAINGRRDVIEEADVAYALTQGA